MARTHVIIVEIEHVKVSTEVSEEGYRIEDSVGTVRVMEMRPILFGQDKSCKNGDN
jgi:hypothetical protein